MTRPRSLSYVIVSSSNFWKSRPGMKERKNTNIVGRWDFLSLDWTVFWRITSDTDECKPRGAINSYGPADCLDWAIWFNSQRNFHIAKSPFGSYVWDLYSIYLDLLWLGLIPKTSERVWVVIAWSVIVRWIVWTKDLRTMSRICLTRQYWHRSQIFEPFGPLPLF